MGGGGQKSTFSESSFQKDIKKLDLVVVVIQSKTYLAPHNNYNPLTQATRCVVS